MGNLEKHIRVHTGMSIYRQSLDIIFGLLQMIRNRMDSISGERPYICPVCNKGFSQSGYVAIHLRYVRR